MTTTFPNTTLERISLIKSVQLWMSYSTVRGTVMELDSLRHIDIDPDFSACMKKCSLELDRC